MFQAVCRQPVTARVQITSRAKIMVGIVVLESYFLRVLRVLLYDSDSIISLETVETFSSLSQSLYKQSN